MNTQFKLSALAALICLSQTTPAQQSVIRIGHVGPTSGGVAHLGKDNENGARMAADEINARGLVIGGKRYRLVLQMEDDTPPSRIRLILLHTLLCLDIYGREHSNN